MVEGQIGERRRLSGEPHLEADDYLAGSHLASPKSRMFIRWRVVRRCLLGQHAPSIIATGRSNENCTARQALNASPDEARYAGKRARQRHFA